MSESQWQSIEEDIDSYFNTDITLIRVPAKPLLWPPDPEHYDVEFAKFIDERFPRSEDAEVREAVDRLIGQLKQKKSDKDRRLRSAVSGFAISLFGLWFLGLFILAVSRKAGVGGEMGSTLDSLPVPISTSVLVLCLLIFGLTATRYVMLNQQLKVLRLEFDRDIYETIAKFGSKMQFASDQIWKLYDKSSAWINSLRMPATKSAEDQQIARSRVTRCAKVLIWLEKKIEYYEQRIESSVWAYYRWEHYENFKLSVNAISQMFIISFIGVVAATATRMIFLEFGLAPGDAATLGLVTILGALFLAFVQWYKRVERILLTGKAYLDEEMPFWSKLHAGNWKRKSEFQLQNFVSTVLDDQIREIHRLEGFARAQ